MARLLLVKGMSWAYEKEVRLLVDLEGAHDIGKEDENGRPIKVIEPPPEAIREIYDGANTGMPTLNEPFKWPVAITRVDYSLDIYRPMLSGYRRPEGRSIDLVLPNFLLLTEGWVRRGNWTGKRSRR